MTALRGARVALRPWVDADLEPFAAMNADAEVMRHFVAPLTRAESDALAERLRAVVESLGYGLWALDVPGLGFAGFVGLSPSVPFDVPGFPAPVTEIGWRLARAAWGRGYATEAARLALDYAFGRLGAEAIVSFTATSNLRSQAVMQRLGLVQRGEFDHPRIAEGHPLRRHVLYAIDAASFAPASKAS
jgi:RimJ/RimL family protein N-acetyltransferase